MKVLTPILIGLLVVGCGESPTVEIADPIVEKAIRRPFGGINKPTGELTEADLEKVTELRLRDNQLTEVPKGLEKLTSLNFLDLMDNPDLTKAQIAELQKALPKCEIYSNPTK